jgi:hypothetical protein
MAARADNGWVAMWFGAGFAIDMVTVADASWLGNWYWVARSPLELGVVVVSLIA